MADEEREQHERAQVELVFGLTGGELNDDPWCPTYVTETYGETRTYVATYNYDGPPEWAEDTHDDWATVTYRTMVRDNLIGCDAPSVVNDDNGTWQKVATYASSGETDCYCEGNDKACYLCGGDGYVYVGDGWAEIVYRLETEETEDNN